jgi:hypothetical protein
VTPAPRLQHRRYRRQYYQALGAEASLKIFVNGLLLATFAVALTRLVPEMLQNHHQQISIEKELTLTEKRVHHLNQEFSQTFAPDSSLRLIEQQSYPVDPRQQRIIFLEKPNPATANPGERGTQNQRNDAPQKDVTER